MQTGSSETLIIGLKSGKTTYVPVWDRMAGAQLWTLKTGVKNSFIRSFGSWNLSLPMDSVVHAYTYSRWTYAVFTELIYTYSIYSCWKFPTLGLITPQCPPPLPPPQVFPVFIEAMYGMSGMCLPEAEFMDVNGTKS